MQAQSPSNPLVKAISPAVEEQLETPPQPRKRKRVCCSPRDSDVDSAERKTKKQRAEEPINKKTVAALRKTVASFRLGLNASKMRKATLVQWEVILNGLYRAVAALAAPKRLTRLQFGGDLVSRVASIQRWWRRVRFVNATDPVTLERIDQKPFVHVQGDGKRFRFHAPSLAQFIESSAKFSNIMTGIEFNDVELARLNRCLRANRDDSTVNFPDFVEQRKELVEEKKRLDERRAFEQVLIDANNDAIADVFRFLRDARRGPVNEWRAIAFMTDLLPEMIARLEVLMEHSTVLAMSVSVDIVKRLRAAAVIQSACQFDRIVVAELTRFLQMLQERHDAEILQTE